MMCICESHQHIKQIDETVEVHESLVVLKGSSSNIFYSPLSFSDYAVISIPIKILLVNFISSIYVIISFLHS